MSKKEVAEHKTGAGAGERAVKRSGDVMYLGPTIAGVARHSTTFKGGVLPQKAEECISLFPLMKKLFVPLKDMPPAVKALNGKKGVLWEIYTQTARKFIQEGK